MNKDDDEDAPDSAVMAAFKQRRTRQYLTLVPTLAALLPIVFLDLESELSNKHLVMAGLSVAVLVGTVVFSRYNWRCPSCNGYLGRSITHKFCPKCGVQLA